MYADGIERLGVEHGMHRRQKVVQFLKKFLWIMYVSSTYSQRR